MAEGTRTGGGDAGGGRSGRAPRAGATAGRRPTLPTDPMLGTTTLPEGTRVGSYSSGPTERDARRSEKERVVGPTSATAHDERIEASDARSPWVLPIYRDQISNASALFSIATYARLGTFTAMATVARDTTEGRIRLDPILACRIYEYGQNASDGSVVTFLDGAARVADVLSRPLYQFARSLWAVAARTQARWSASGETFHQREQPNLVHLQIAFEAALVLGETASVAGGGLAACSGEHLKQLFNDAVEFLNSPRLQCAYGADGAEMMLARLLGRPVDVRSYDETATSGVELLEFAADTMGTDRAPALGLAESDFAEVPMDVLRAAVQYVLARRRLGGDDPPSRPERQVSGSDWTAPRLSRSGPNWRW